MNAATAAQMRAIDRRAIDDFGIPGPVLMEAAGIALVRACIEELRGAPTGKRVAVFCGRGNNGGDGFVAARHLSIAGVLVTVFLTHGAEELSPDARVHFAPLRGCGVRLIDITGPDFDGAARRDWDLAIDCVLGTGARGPLQGVIGLAIAHLAEMAEAGTPVVACDIPSGVNADTGELIDWVAVKATRTVTFALPKPGLLQFPGRERAGRITVADIGIPRALLSDNPALMSEITTRQWMREHLPRREQSRDANKGAFGTVLVVAGSAGMMGAAVLTAIAALRAGAGLVQLALPESLLDVAATLAPEVILKPLAQTPERTHGGQDAVEQALALADKADAVAIGPGMSGNPAVASFVQPFIRRVGKPLVVDADGLNALRSSLTSVRYRGATPTVLTPHPGEMGRLLGISTADVQANRLESALRCASTFKAVALLKGARTLIATPDGRMAFNRLGSPALATAGTGDVLTGTIAALLAQKHDAWDAARIGAYLHALAGDVAAEQHGLAGVLATDVRDCLPQARERLYHSGDTSDEDDL